MKYSIVLTTYNHCDDLLKPCVDSIFKFSNIYDIELIISANGCKDNTREYLQELEQIYKTLNIKDHFKIVWHDEPLGYAKANNVGIEAATTDLIVLLNNDTVLLPQHRNQWLDALAAPFVNNQNCGISCVAKMWSEILNSTFAIFFCVMIHRKVFDKLGLLSLDYGDGAGEDTEFSIECEKAGFDVVECYGAVQTGGQFLVGSFPIYHKGEGTVHDTELVQNWQGTFNKNTLTLAKKYNPAWYEANKQRLS